MSDVKPLKIAVMCHSNRQVSNIINDLIWSNGGRFSRISRTRGKITTKRGDDIRFYTLNSNTIDGIKADVVVSDPFTISDYQYFILQQIVCASREENKIWTFGDFERFLERLPVYYD